MDYLSMAYEEGKPLPHNLFEENSWHHMAKKHPQYRNFNLCISSQHLHHLDTITTSLGWTCCLHESSLPPEKSAL